MKSENGTLLLCAKIDFKVDKLLSNSDFNGLHFAFVFIKSVKILYISASNKTFLTAFMKLNRRLIPPRCPKIPGLIHFAGFVKQLDEKTIDCLLFGPFRRVVLLWY